MLLKGQPGEEELKFFSQNSAIFGLELSAIVLAIFRLRTIVRNCSIVIYTDNNAALAALINGDSSSGAAFALIAVFWFLAASYNIAIWLERVETKRNIADLPTRGVEIPFTIRETETSPPLREALSFYTQHIAINAPTLEDLTLAEPLIPLRDL